MPFFDPYFNSTAQYSALPGAPGGHVAHVAGQQVLVVPHDVGVAGHTGHLHRLLLKVAEILKDAPRFCLRIHAAMDRLVVVCDGSEDISGNISFYARFKNLYKVF